MQLAFGKGLGRRSIESDAGLHGRRANRATAALAALLLLAGCASSPDRAPRAALEGARKPVDLVVSASPTPRAPAHASPVAADARQPAPRASGPGMTGAPAGNLAFAAPAAGRAKAAAQDSEETHSPSYAPAQLVTGAPPAYPDSSRRAGEAGTVSLRTCVASDGRVASVEIVKGSGFPALDASAVAAVKAWTFVGATRDGTPMDSLLTHSITFKLDGRSR